MKFEIFTNLMIFIDNKDSEQDTNVIFVKSHDHSIVL